MNVGLDRASFLQFAVLLLLIYVRLKLVTWTKKMEKDEATDWISGDI